ncbi:hypothetical protein FQN57_006192 [Myotisia sp. PD_48]|nr:hypothetical protein FQN57_006192 [Myotisia sp. PD_48]
MELSRHEYPALADLMQPTQAIAVLNERIRSINKLNADVADWLMDRRKLEEAYTLGLRKLARRPQPDAGPTLGVFEIPWQHILSATESLAQSHETLALEMEMDVERPLREYATKNNEMKFMGSVSNDLASLVKNLEVAQKKAGKFKDKGPKAAGKAFSAASTVEEVKTQWQSRAPHVFEQLQIIDENRVNHLRDVLTQFQTHETDHVERSRQAAESSLNALLNIEASEEIRSFVMTKSGGRIAETPNRQATPAPPASPPAPMDPLPAPPRIHDDAASQRSGRSNPGRPSYQGTEPRQTSSFGGLKRLGTVMGRRKSIVNTPPPGSSSPERKFRSAFTFRRAESSRSFQQMERHQEAPNGLARVTSNERQMVSRDGPPHSRPSSSAQGIPRTEPIVESAETVNGAAVPSMPTIPDINGDTIEADPNPPKPQTDAEGYSERPDIIDEITKVQREAASPTEESGINLTIRDTPIPEDESQAKQALTEMASTLRKQAQQSGISRATGTLRGRRDVRNTIFIPNPPSQNEGLSGTLPVLGLTPSPIPRSPEQQVKSVVPSEKSILEENALSDTTSIHSSHTLHSLSGPIAHPELSGSGMNASIVEKLTVLISEGKVARSYVVGELALAYNASADQPIPDTQLVRLDNFHNLERVAANPQFVSEKPNGIAVSSQDNSISEESNKGQYSVRLAAINGHSPIVAFKYQVHLDPSNLSSYCPIIFTPIWNEEEFQASVIVQYSLNPQFNSFAPGAVVVLRNLSLTVSLDLSPTDETTKQPREVARATGAAMHPNTGAIFRRKNSSVVWKIPELELSAVASGKFLARFSTATKWPKKGKIEVKFDATSSENGSRLGLSTYEPSTTGEDKKEDDPFADEDGNSPATPDKPKSSTGTWTQPLTERKLSVARYIST